MKRWLALGGWLVGLAMSAGLLVRLGGSGRIAIDWADPLTWMAAEPLDVVLAGSLRTMGLAIIVWIGATSVIYLIARIAGFDRGAIEWMSIGPIRRTVDALLAGTLVVSSFSPGVAMAADEVPIPPAVSVVAVDPQYVPIPAGPESPQTQQTDTEIPEEPEPATTVVVEEGDHLWGLAKRHLAQHLDRNPSNEETARYWRHVVDVNTPHLESGQADLIYPGETISLPSLPDGP